MGDDDAAKSNGSEAADGSDASAYLPPGGTISNKKSTTLDTTAKIVTDSVAAFKNLPPSVGGLKRNEARRAVVKAIIAANPGTDAKKAREQADILLGG